jgi:hypothetical protein
MDARYLCAKVFLLVNQREKYHMGPLIRCGIVVGEALTCARTRFTYQRSELMAPYGTFLADLPIVNFFHEIAERSVAISESL